LGRFEKQVAFAQRVMACLGYVVAVPKSPHGGKKQSNDGCACPAHLVVVSKQLNINLIDNEIEWHPQHEQKGKAPHLVRHHWDCFAADEGHSQ